MSDRATWFEYIRPHPGKISARPIHPIGWALLLGLPVPGICVGMLLGRYGHPVIGLAMALLLTGIGMWQLFRIVRRHGREVG